MIGGESGDLGMGWGGRRLGLVGVGRLWKHRLGVGMYTHAHTQTHTAHGTHGTHGTHTAPRRTWGMSSRMTLVRRPDLSAVTAPTESGADKALTPKRRDESSSRDSRFTSAKMLADAVTGKSKTGKINVRKSLNALLPSLVS